ncbi:MFS transporter, partial [Roseibium sp. RKSG952]|uniref:MFS transporter n=1 Tax=Roseibium sp. RKSG952 TaxID=2529384 RepID=UPI0012BCC718
MKNSIKKNSSRHSMIFIVITIAITSLGNGIVTPVLPFLIKELSNSSVSSAASWGGLLVSVYAIVLFFASPAIGSMSDIYGRRPFLIYALLLLSIDYVIMAIAPNLLILFIGRIASGLGSATFAVATAYIIDVSHPEDRIKNFGLAGAGTSIGIAAGPAIGGLVGELGTRAPFYAASFIVLATLIYGFLVLPETLPKN